MVARRRRDRLPVCAEGSEIAGAVCVSVCGEDRERVPDYLRRDAVLSPQVGRGQVVSTPVVSRVDFAAQVAGEIDVLR